MRPSCALLCSSSLVPVALYSMHPPCPLFPAPAAPRSCRLITNCVVEARRHGVRPHKVASYVRRRLGGGLCVVRYRSDGSPGCSAPCTLCAREILKYDLKVCCLLESGEIFCGRLTDPGAPPAKVTGGQRAWLRWWACCQAGRPNGRPSQPRPDESPPPRQQQPG